MRTKPILIIIVVLIVLKAKGQGDGLKNQKLLHPGDAFTAYTFQKGEWAYNQSITPYPGWAWWGVTDWFTAEIDIEAWLGGVLSFNFRFSFLEQKKIIPSLAYETMYQYIHNEIDQMENLDYLSLKRKGSNWYNRINASWKAGSSFYIHFSAGLTFSESLTIDNNDTVDYVGKSFQKLISPDFSAAVEWRATNWLSLNTGYSHGSTFLYLDNVPRKEQFVFATRLAPFYKKRFTLLKSLRLELAFLHANFNDANENITGPIGFIYWQWNWRK